MTTTTSRPVAAPASRSKRLVKPLAGKLNLPGVGFMILLFVAWELADQAGLIDLMFLPRPSEIFTAGANLIAENEFFPTVGHTVSVTLLGWSIASCSGLLIGFALGMLRPVWTYSMSTIELFRALPSIVLLPIAVLVFGFSVEQELVLVIVSAQWPVMVAAIDGVRLIPQGLRDTATTLRLGKFEATRKIVFPGALPRVLVGLRLSLALSLILTVAAEMLGNPEGMGHALVAAQEALKADEMFFYFISIGILGVILNAVFIFLAKVLTPGHHLRSEEKS